MMRTDLEGLTVKRLSRLSELSILEPGHTLEDVRRGCEQAAANEFAAVCVAPYAVEEAVGCLHGTPVATCGVVGWPMGYSAPGAKIDEARTCLEAGASEIEVSLNLPALKSGYADVVAEELAALRGMTKGCALKVAIECGYLSDVEKARACKVAVEAGADVVQTASGFHGQASTPSDLQLLARMVGDKCEFKGEGVRDFDVGYRLLRSGASRLGTDRPDDLLTSFYEFELKAAQAS